MNKLSEFELIKFLNSNLKKADIPLANGDDAAVFKSGNSFTAVSVDSFSQDIHFSFDYFSPEEVGRKIIEASASDLIACGAKPKYFLISISIPERITNNFLKDIYLGINSSLERLGSCIIGGDTISAKNDLVFSITAIGEIKSEDKIIRRSNAKVGDVIYLSELTGKSALGLYTLQNNIDCNYSKYHLNSKARIDLLDQFSLVNSMIDTSDGLSSELGHLSRLSKLSMNINKESLVFDKDFNQECEKLNLDPLELILNGGEDFELLYTSSEELPGIKIGFVSEGDCNYLIDRDSKKVLESKGYKHL